VAKVTQMMMHEKRGATQNYVDKDVGECALGEES
jgi:hypothetical protein